MGRGGVARVRVGRWGAARWVCVWVCACGERGEGETETEEGEGAEDDKEHKRGGGGAAEEAAAESYPSALRMIWGGRVGIDALAITSGRNFQPML